MPRIMVWINNPEDYPSWSTDAKRARAAATLEWHGYIRELRKKRKVTHIWGSHQLLSRGDPSHSQGILISVYDTESWEEFDDLLARDPLRHSSTYVTTPLCSLLEDRDTDLARYEAHKKQYFGENPSAVRLMEYEKKRGLFNNAPDYVGTLNYQAPKNKKTNIKYTYRPGDPIEILLLGSNPDEYITMWDDLTKLIHHEKVMWWHDYTSKLVAEGKVTHCWGTNDFCLIDRPSAKSAAAVSVFRVADFEEFDGLYKMDPIRQSTIFWSVLLRPIADQLKFDQKRFELF